MELRVSLDEREDADEEQEIAIEGVPFVVSHDVIDSYGETYNVFVGENGIPGVSSPMQQAQTGASVDGKKEACSLSKG